MMMNPAQIILTNCPNNDVAQRLGRLLVEGKLAACVSILAPCRSIYVWQDKLCEDDEVPLLIKTTAAGYPAVEAMIRQHHPYELPEIVAVDIAQGLPAYLTWLDAQVCAPSGGNCGD